MVGTDVPLTKWHEHNDLSQLEEVVPPKWLEDSLEDSGLKCVMTMMIFMMMTSGGDSLLGVC